MQSLVDVQAEVLHSDSSCAPPVFRAGGTEVSAGYVM